MLFFCWLFFAFFEIVEIQNVLIEQLNVFCKVNISGEEKQAWFQKKNCDNLARLVLASGSNRTCWSHIHGSLEEAQTEELQKNL